MIWLQSLTTPRVGLVDLGRPLVGLALDLALLAGAEVVDDAAEVGLLHDGARLPVARPDVGEDVVLEAHHELVAGGEVHRLDRVEAGEVVGILHRHPHRALPPLERRADVLLQEVGGDALLQVLGDRRRRWAPRTRSCRTGPSARRTSSFGTRISSIRIFATSSWLTRAAEIAFSTSFSETRPLSTRAPNLDGLLRAGGAVLVVERDAEDLGELLRRLLRRGRRRRSPPRLLTSWRTPRRYLSKRIGDREDLGRAEAGRLVPARVEPQARVERSRAPTRRRRS